MLVLVHLFTPEHLCACLKSNFLALVRIVTFPFVPLYSKYVPALHKTGLYILLIHSRQNMKIKKKERASVPLAKLAVSLQPFRGEGFTFIIGTDVM
jgi:hypothetical protein